MVNPIHDTSKLTLIYEKDGVGVHSSTRNLRRAFSGPAGPGTPIPDIHTSIPDIHTYIYKTSKHLSKTSKL